VTILFEIAQTEFPFEKAPTSRHHFHRKSSNRSDPYIVGRAPGIKRFLVDVDDGRTAFTHTAPGNSLISPKLTLSAGFSTSVALCALLNLGSFWLLPPWDFPDQLRVTLWITTAIHVDTPTVGTGGCPIKRVCE
jgi:hypothetical protein